MSELTEVPRPTCAICGNYLDEHWRRRACCRGESDKQAMIDITKQRAECARMQAVCDAATGPSWEAREVGIAGRTFRVEIVAPQYLHGRRTHSRDICQVPDYHTWTDHPANVKLITDARTDWPALIKAHLEACDEIERQSSQLQQLKEANAEQVCVLGRVEQALRDAMGTGGNDFDDLPGLIRKQAAEVKRLRDLAGRLADDVQSEVDARYKGSAGDIHPAIRWRYERDLTNVTEAREVLG